jgi:hypothetical protein
MYALRSIRYLLLVFCLFDYCILLIFKDGLDNIWRQQLEVLCHIYVVLTIRAVFSLRYVLLNELKFRWQLQAMELVSSGCQVGVNLFFNPANFDLLQQLVFLRNFQGRFKRDVACSHFFFELTDVDCSPNRYVREVSEEARRHVLATFPPASVFMALRAYQTLPSSFSPSRRYSFPEDCRLLISGKLQLFSCVC